METTQIPDFERITALPDRHVFVFGSNESGLHGGGAARDAERFFGAEYGVGWGLSRNRKSFAIPTKDYQIRTLPLETVGLYVELFKDTARRYPELTFHVTAIGTGLAGFAAEEIAPMFANATENVILCSEFREVLDAMEDEETTP